MLNEGKKLGKRGLPTTQRWAGLINHYWDEPSGRKEQGEGSAPPSKGLGASRATGPPKAWTVSVRGGAAGGDYLGVTRTTSRGPALVGGVEGGRSPSTTMSMESGRARTKKAGREWIVGRGRAGQSFKVAVWSSQQLPQWGGEVRQLDGTGISFPPHGQVGF